MTQTEIAARELPWWKEVTRYQWTILLMCWLGFMFDLMDSTLYSLVMAPALTELLGGTASVQDIGWYGGLITALLLAGWAIGGIVFGVVADYYGRKLTLMVTIAIYATFTGMAAFADSWWELGLYRFLTGLGVGGEWAAGAALLAETWPERARAKGAAILQMSAGVGYFVAALITLVVGSQNWRVVFLVGVLPAILLFFVRREVGESERWRAVSASPAEASNLRRSRPFTLAQVFGRDLRRDTIVGSVLASIVNFGFWAVTSWVPPLVYNRFTQDPSLGAGASVSAYVSYAIMIMTAGSLPGYIVAGYLADRLGRRGAFLLFFLGALIVTPTIFLGPWSSTLMMMLLPFLGFFTMGVYALFPIYLPELYPTHLRGTGAGFCFNIGRVVSAFGPFLTGTVIFYTGSFEYAISALSLVYLIGPVTLIFARETRGIPLA